MYALSYRECKYEKLFDSMTNEDALPQVPLFCIHEIFTPTSMYYIGFHIQSILFIIVKSSIYNAIILLLFCCCFVANGLG